MMTTRLEPTRSAVFREEQPLIDAVHRECRRGDYAAAEAVCRNHLASETLGPAAHYLLGLVKICLQETDQGRILLEASLALAPRNAACGKMLAEVSLHQGQPAQAASLYKQLLSLDPNDEDVIGRLNRHYSAIPLEPRIEAIRREAQQILKERRGQAEVRVLYGPAFSIYAPCRLHDFLMTQALRLRGARITPVTLIHEAGQELVFAQQGENGYFGGVWGGYSGDPRRDRTIGAKDQRALWEADRRLWKSWCGLDPVSAARYLYPEDRRRCHEAAQTIRPAHYAEFTWEDLPVGRWAADTLFNNETIVDPAQIENFEFKLRSHVENVLLLITAYSRLLEAVRPEVIVTNDTYYYTWAVLEALAQRQGIPCYNHWQGSRRNGWCYNRDQASMELDLAAPWQAFRRRPLEPVQAARIEDFLLKRRKGAGMILNTACPEQVDTLPGRLVQALSQYSHCSLLCANAIWDLAVLNKEIVFKGMMDWIGEVIEHFAARPDKLLIVKAHPAETNPDIPRTRQSVGAEIARRFDRLPENVIFIDSDARFSVYDILDHIDLGLVYTTTTGLEMACEGLPVLTAARSAYRDKGFTLDPSTREDYFRMLDDRLGGTRDSEEAIGNRRQLARQFFYLYYFRYFCSLNLFEHGYKGAPVLYVDSAKELLPGTNAVLDYVCDAVLGRRPVVAADRLAPEGQYRRTPYEFAPAEVRRDAALAVAGYPQVNPPQLLETANGFERYRIADHEFCVPAGRFRKSELQWLYNEIHLGPEQNAHAYEGGGVQLRPGDVVVDAGACEGFFVDYALRRGAAKVFAFEPHPEIAAGLRLTYRQPVMQGTVSIVVAALGDQSGRAAFDDGGEFICEARLAASGRIPVDLITLDRFVREANVERIDFIKADVEGQEMAMTEGMAEVLRRWKPRLSIAVYHDVENARRVREQILRIRPDYHVSFGGCWLFQSPPRPFMLYAY